MIFAKGLRLRCDLGGQRDLTLRGFSIPFGVRIHPVTQKGRAGSIMSLGRFLSPTFPATVHSAAPDLPPDPQIVACNARLPACLNCCMLVACPLNLSSLLSLAESALVCDVTLAVNETLLFTATLYCLTCTWNLSHTRDVPVTYCHWLGSCHLPFLQPIILLLQMLHPIF